MMVFFRSCIAPQQYKAKRHALPTPQPPVSPAFDAWRVNEQLHKWAER
jgi:hypothetical protein